MEREQIVAEARTWLGVRWHHQGRSRAGVDCAGLLVCVAQAVGLQVQDYKGYQRRTSGGEFLRHFKTQLAAKTTPEPGDVLVFIEPKYPCHCGIFTRKNGQDYFIHAYAKRKKVVEEPLAFDWPRKLIAVFAWPEVDNG